MSNEESTTGLTFATKNQEVKTRLGTFNFSYRNRPIYLDSPARQEIERINLPKLFISETDKAAKDLDINGPLKISVKIPNPIEDYIIPELGIGAWTESDKEVRFYLNPNHKQIVENLVLWQTRQIAHEFNHLARWNFSGETLLDALIFEGLATNYEENWGGKKQETLWGYALEPKQLKVEWQKAQKELDSTLTPDNYRDWFFGTSHGHPRWTGYALGTTIVKSYLDRHPNEPMKETVKKESQEILDQSEFAKS